MATQFLFNANEVKGVASKLKQKATKLQSTQRELKTTINKVSSWWEGESESAFIEQYNKFEPSLKELEELAKAIAKQLDDIAKLKMENETKRSKMFK